MRPEMHAHLVIRTCPFWLASSRQPLPDHIGGQPLKLVKLVNSHSRPLPRPPSNVKPFRETLALRQHRTGNITLGGASGGGDKQQYAVGNTCSAFVSGTFRTEDLFHGPGVGVIDTNALTVGLGRLIEGTLTNGAIRVG
jgi:hypothetical protein